MRIFRGASPKKTVHVNTSNTASTLQVGVPLFVDVNV